MSTVPMIESLKTFSTSPFTDNPLQFHSEPYQATQRTLIDVISESIATVAVMSSSTTTTTFPTTSVISNTNVSTELYGNDNLNVSNHIRQVFYASSTAIGNMLTNNMSGSIGINDTMPFNRSEAVVREFIFDRTDVRIIFITLYSLVFFCCFFGK